MLYWCLKCAQTDAWFALRLSTCSQIAFGSASSAAAEAGPHDANHQAVQEGVKVSGFAVGDNDLVLLNSVHYESESSSGRNKARLLMIGLFFAPASSHLQAKWQVAPARIRKTFF